MQDAVQGAMELLLIKQSIGGDYVSVPMGE